MADGLGIIIGQNLEPYWCEGDGNDNMSHSTVLERLGWAENKSAQLRFFVRVQFPNYSAREFEYDEAWNLPSWVEGYKPEIKAVATSVLDAMNPIRRKFQEDLQKLRDERDSMMLDGSNVTANLINDQLIREYELAARKLRKDMIEQFKHIPGYVAPDDGDLGGNIL